MQDNLTVKGMFIRANFEALKSKATEEQRDLLDKEYRNLKILPFKDYPIDLQNKLEKFGTNLIFGSNSDEAYRELGFVSFTTFMNSLIGKTMFALVNNDFKKLSMEVNRFWQTVTSGIDIVAKDLGPNSTSVRMKNNPYPPTGIQGIYEAGLKHMKLSGKVDMVYHGGHDYEYIISWGQ